MPKTDPFSIRLTPEQNNRVLDIQRACNGEVTRTDVISASLELLPVVLSVLPSLSRLIELYDVSRDPSVTQSMSRELHGGRDVLR